MFVKENPHRKKYIYIYIIKDTHWKNTPSKNEVLTKTINRYIWGIDTVNQLFVRCSYTQIKFSKKTK